MLRLTQERVRLGWTISALARAAKLDQALVGKIEASRMKPYARQLARLANAIDWPTDRAEELLQEITPQKLDDFPDVLTVPEAAKVLRLGRGAAYEATRRGELPVVRIGNRLIVPKVALQRKLLDSE